MKWTAQQVGAMSLWQFVNSIDGYVEAHSSVGGRPDDATLDELAAMVDAAS